MVDQLAKLQPKPVHVSGASAKKLADFLLEREITIGCQITGEAKGKVEAELAPGFLASLLGKFGIGVELRGGYERSRELTVKIEANTRGFLGAIQELVEDAYRKVIHEGYQGLVVVCDGCDKLTVSATDEKGHSRDLQLALFIGHGADLRSVPCHVIYTVPLSIQANLGDSWEQSAEFVPAIPVNELPGIESSYPESGRNALREVVARRLTPLGSSIAELFAEERLLDRLIETSGGHISDLLIMVQDAVLESQTDEEERVTENCVKRAIRNRATEYTRLIEGKYLPVLASIDQYKTAQSNSDEYRELIFKRLALEYACGTEKRVDLHPLVAASDAYRRYRRPLPV